MVTAQEVITRAAKTLQDPEFVRWTKPELLEWISEAQVAIARTPGAYSKVAVMQLQEGTRQTLPADGWCLITVTRNVDDGMALTPVRLVTRSLLDAVVPDWHMAYPRSLVENFTYDDRFPREFYVYPPNDGEGHVEVIYMGIPDDVVDEGQILELDDTFLPAILNYVLYRAFTKESDYAPGVQNAAAYFQAYQTELAAALEARGRTTPNAALMPNSPVNANGGTE